MILKASNRVNSPWFLALYFTSLFVLKLLHPRPTETQEESVWPRWLLLVNAAKVNEQF